MSTLRNFPLPAPSADPRFTIGLILDVKTVLERHGYPSITSGPDLVELQQALFRFLYQVEPVELDYDRDHSTPAGVTLPDGVEGLAVTGRRAVRDDA